MTEHTPPPAAASSAGDIDSKGQGAGVAVPNSVKPDPIEPDASESGSIEEVTSMVEQPAKVMRIGTMIKQLLEEVRAAPLDEAGRARLREIHETSVSELEQGLAPHLRAELRRLSIPFGDGVPSESELRIAQAQLVGWLEGLFQGIQFAFAQQVASRQEVEGQRRALSGGGPGGGAGGGQGQIVIGPGGQIIAVPSQGGPGGPGGYGGSIGGPGDGGTGQYL